MPITTIAELETIYGEFGAIGEASTAKVADHVTPHYRRYLEAAPLPRWPLSAPKASTAHPAAISPASSASTTTAP